MKIYAIPPYDLQIVSQSLTAIHPFFRNSTYIFLHAFSEQKQPALLNFVQHALSCGCIKQQK
jgi:hypothetical protein